MLKIEHPGYFAKVVQFAAENGCLDKLVERLCYLANYGGTPDYTTCHLHSDWATNSFAFVLYKQDGTRWFTGGLIYSGPGQALDGTAPALTVGIGIDSSQHGWSIHT